MFSSSNTLMTHTHRLILHSNLQIHKYIKSCLASLQVWFTGRYGFEPWQVTCHSLRHSSEDSIVLYQHCWFSHSTSQSHQVTRHYTAETPYVSEHTKQASQSIHSDTIHSNINMTTTWTFHGAELAADGWPLPPNVNTLELAELNANGCTADDWHTVTAPTPPTSTSTVAVISLQI